MISPVYRKTVIPNEASRLIFFCVRSCERVGLRREESLFSVSPFSHANVGSSGPFFSLLRALSAKSFSALFLITRNSLPTTHWFLP